MMDTPAARGAAVAVASPGPGLEPEDNLRRLDAMAWAHQTPRLRALGFDFAVRTSERTTGEYLETLLEAFASPGEPAHVYSFIEQGETFRERYVVYRDGEHVSTVGTSAIALRHLLWDVNRGVLESTSDLLLFHASAAEHDGRALLFPAAMGSGKTTLVAGLVRAGLRYITDEAAAIDPVTLAVQPYPKPLAIDTGSWRVLEGLRPDLEPELEPFSEAAWYVRPGAIRKDAVAGPSEPRFIIAPRYDREARTELVEVPRSEALITLAENSFNITRFGARTGMEVLAAVVRRCRCYRMTVGDLDQACERILELLRERPTDGVDG